jgi:hypothetical protein
MPQPAPFNPPLKTYPFFIFYAVEPTDTCLEDEAWQCRRGSILLRPGSIGVVPVRQCGENCDLF